MHPAGDGPSGFGRSVDQTVAPCQASPSGLCPVKPDTSDLRLTMDVPRTHGVSQRCARHRAVANAAVQGVTDKAPGESYLNR